MRRATVWMRWTDDVFAGPVTFFFSRGVFLLEAVSWICEIPRCTFLRVGEGAVATNAIPL